MRSSDVFDVLVKPPPPLPRPRLFSHALDQVSCADFTTFKELMLAHKTEMNGVGPQLKLDVRPVSFFSDEQVPHPRLSSRRRRARFITSLPRPSSLL